MNIHPIFVHFPIALLSIYAVMELLRFRRLMSLKGWRYVKATFLVLGILGGFAAVFTGDFGREAFPMERGIIEVHETVAQLTVSIFSLLALYYIVDLFDEFYGMKIRASRYAKLFEVSVRIKDRLFEGWFVSALALIGFILLFLTGALGARIVYGENGDIFTQLVSRLFGL